MNNFDENNKIDEENIMPSENNDENIFEEGVELDDVQDTELDLDEEYIEEESEDESLSSDYSDYSETSYNDYSNNNFQNQRLQNNLRNLRNSKKNENVPEKLKEDKSQKLNKNLSNSTENVSDSIKEKASSGLKESGEGLAKNGVNKAAKGLSAGGTKAAAGAAAEGTTAAAGAAAEGAATGLAALVANPYFWVVVGIVLLILFLMLVVVMWAAYDDGDDDNSSSGSSSSNVEYVEGYEDCESITVIGLGTYSIEDYVAGVVEHEAYKDESIEALKAQAVAARTYAINGTNKCKKAISNSTSAQTFSTKPSEIAKQAAEETKGQVLTYNGKVFSAMYDSFCYNDKDCPDSTKNVNGSYTVTYYKMPNEEKHQITLSQSKQYPRIVSGAGHAHGMSQLLSYELASMGKSYQEILKYFYSDGVEISAITEEAATSTDENGNVNNKNVPNGSFAEFNIRKKKPSWLVSPDKKYYTKQISSDPFQCVWYAKARAVEILSTMKNADSSKKEKAIKTIMSATGHGSYWYNNAQGNGSMSIFSSSNDYTKPRPGAMISWKWTNERWSKSKSVCSTVNCGHVGIIESVDEANKTVVISDGWKECSDWSNSKCLGFRNQTWTYEELKSYGGGYVFLGYVYVADYARGGS